MTAKRILPQPVSLPKVLQDFEHVRTEQDDRLLRLLCISPCQPAEVSHALILPAGITKFSQWRRFSKAIGLHLEAMGSLGLLARFAYAFECLRAENDGKCDWMVAMLSTLQDMIFRDVEVSQRNQLQIFSVRPKSSNADIRKIGDVLHNTAYNVMFAIRTEQPSLDELGVNCWPLLECLLRTVERQFRDEYSLSDNYALVLRQFLLEEEFLEFHDQPLIPFSVLYEKIIQIIQISIISGIVSERLGTDLRIIDRS